MTVNKELLEAARGLYLREYLGPGIDSMALLRRAAIVAEVQGQKSMCRALNRMADELEAAIAHAEEAEKQAVQEEKCACLKSDCPDCHPKTAAPECTCTYFGRRLDGGYEWRENNPSCPVPGHGQKGGE